MKLIYTNEEYFKIVQQKNIKVIFTVSLIGAFIVANVMLLLLISILGLNIKISLILASILFVAFFMLLLIISLKKVKQVNNLNDIEKIEQEINDEYIKEIVYRENDVVDESIYKYNDIVKVKSDKNNYYLYIASFSFLIINKNKIENIKKFKEKINEIKHNTLLKK